jgi:hypothetical protein
LISKITFVITNRGARRNALTLLSRRRTVFIGALVALTLAPTAAHAADNASGSWSANSYTGYCGQVDGGYVLAAQSMLKTFGAYSGKLDNYWGTQSGNALVAYQTARGLSADGCAGPSTWANMQALIMSFQTGAVCGSTQGTYYRYTRFGTRYFLRPATGTRYWAVDSGADSASPVAAFQYYRFSDNLVTYC